MDEASLYAPVVEWLKGYLKSRQPRSKVFARDCHRTHLSRVVRQLGLLERFPQSELWEIKIDVVGIVISPRSSQMVLVECKADQITLMDVCQLLGYSLVVKPAAALLVSPCPISDGLAQLLRVHGRYDILEYERHRRLRIATWNAARGEIDHASVLPPGEHL
ncbi:MAG: hypothetical protein FJ290_06000 [Planctomycetes bacterium]|nr:hypothetical protein [Planctomycetota bacterium]